MTNKNNKDVKLSTNWMNVYGVKWYNAEHIPHHTNANDNNTFLLRILAIIEFALWPFVMQCAFHLVAFFARDLIFFNSGS